MADLVFPQLGSGALVQYPLRKKRLIQSPLNAFADGSLLVSNLNALTQSTWELPYVELNVSDQTALQNHFNSCQGSLRPFVFVDPTGNMLSNSISLAPSTWSIDPLVSVTGGAPDPSGGTTALTLVNSAQIDQRISQTLLAPAYFQYCFSLYASAPTPTTLRLGQTATSSQSQTFPVSAIWSRLVASSKFSDSDMSYVISIIVPAAQTVTVWGPQLEPQLAPSGYQPTAEQGGIYPNAHFLGNAITFESEAPGLFSTLITIETT